MEITANKLKGYKLSQYNGQDDWPNEYKFAVNYVKVDEFNNLVSLFHKSDLHIGVTHTKSGAISRVDPYCNSFWEIKGHKSIDGNKSSFITLQFVAGDIAAKFKINLGRQDEQDYITGKDAYFGFKKALADNGIDINNYMTSIDEGIANKRAIPKPLIELTNDCECDVTYNKAYHIDINSAYPFYMTQLYPEWLPTIKNLYEKRKYNKLFKKILVETCGYFQSKYVQYRLSHVAKYAIENTILRLKEYESILLRLNCKVLAFNTDGLWFTSNEIDVVKHKLSKDIGSQLGQIKIDCYNCTIRFKSPGAYEYIDNHNNYNCVLRGSTRLDRVKDRSQWSWGDIYQPDCNVIMYNYIDDPINESEYGYIREVYYEFKK